MQKDKEYKVEILGHVCRLIGDDNKEHVLASVDIVNRIGDTISHASPQVNQTMTALLVAVRIASDFLYVRGELKHVEHVSHKLIQLIDQECDK